jgi:hypothetical protein
MKITVRTSVSIRVYPADGFLPSEDASARAWTRVDMARTRVDTCPRGHGGADFLGFRV